MRLIRNAIAFIRGRLYRIVIPVLHSKSHIGTFFRAFNKVELRVGKKSVLVIGNAVRIDQYSTISVLKGGKIIIGDNSGIGQNNIIVCHDFISIGEGTTIGPYVCIYDHDHVFDPVNGVDQKSFITKPVVIGNNCWIGANTIILRGTEIGDNCVIAAGSVIKGSYRDNSLVIQKRNTIIKEVD